MRFFTSTLATTVALGLLAGCSGNMAATPSAFVPSVQGQSPIESGLPLSPALKLVAGHHISPATNTNLYVANAGNNTVGVYLQGTSTEIREINAKKGKIGHPHCLAVDTSNYLYVCNQESNSVTVYLPETTTPSYVITGKDEINVPTAVAVGPAGTAWVANIGNNTVTGYNKHTNVLLQQIEQSQGIQAPRALAIDSSANLYVANGPSSSCPKGSVTVYIGKPGMKVLKWTLTDNIDNPRALAFDSSGNLYVANDDGTSNSSVTEYGPYSSTMKNQMLASFGQNVLNGANALALDEFGDVFVSSAGANSVAEYAGPIHTLVEQLTDKVNNPQSLVVQPDGELAVANYGGGTVSTSRVTEYGPVHPKPAPAPLVTIAGSKTGVDGPLSLVVGP